MPAEVRKALHLKPRQQLIYEVVDGAVVVKPQPETLKDLYGCLASKRPAACFQIRRASSSTQDKGFEICMTKYLLDTNVLIRFLLSDL